MGWWSLLAWKRESQSPQNSSRPNNQTNGATDPAGRKLHRLWATTVKHRWKMTYFNSDVALSVRLSFQFQNQVDLYVCQFKTRSHLILACMHSNDHNVTCSLLFVTFALVYALNAFCCCCNSFFFVKLFDLIEFWKMQHGNRQITLLFFFFYSSLCLSCNECLFLPDSGRVAKEVIEASSKIQREPPEVRR